MHLPSRPRVHVEELERERGDVAKGLRPFANAFWLMGSSFSNGVASVITPVLRQITLRKVILTLLASLIIVPTVMFYIYAPYIQVPERPKLEIARTEPASPTLARRIVNTVSAPVGSVSGLVVNLPIRISNLADAVIGLLRRIGDLTLTPVRLVTKFGLSAGGASAKNGSWAVWSALSRAGSLATGGVALLRGAVDHAVSAVFVVLDVARSFFGGMATGMRALGHNLGKLLQARPSLAPSKPSAPPQPSQPSQPQQPTQPSQPQQQQPVVCPPVVQQSQPTIQQPPAVALAQHQALSETVELLRASVNALSAKLSQLNATHQESLATLAGAVTDVKSAAAVAASTLAANLTATLAKQQAELAALTAQQQEQADTIRVQDKRQQETAAEVQRRLDAQEKKLDSEHEQVSDMARVMRSLPQDIGRELKTLGAEVQAQREADLKALEALQKQQAQLKEQHEAQAKHQQEQQESQQKALEAVQQAQQQQAQQKPAAAAPLPEDM